MCGIGRPIMCPIERYIRTARNPIDTNNRTFIARDAETVSPFFLSLGGSFAFFSSIGDAEKPAFATAAHILSESSGESSASTTSIFASKFTLASCTPSIRRVTRSTEAEQAAQLMPSTVNFSFIGFSPQKTKLSLFSENKQF